MKLKLRLETVPKHSDVVPGVAWNTSDSILSLGDDHQLLMWNLAKNETIKVTEVPPDLFPTGIQWPPKNHPGAGSGSSGGGGGGGGGDIGRKGAELLLVTGADGNFHLLGRGGRIEKSVSGHKGAVLCGSWNWDGSEILTSGEDGCLRIWSRTGMLRSTLAQCPEPIYACAWGPDSGSVVYSTGSNLTIKSTVPNTKPVTWKGHDGLILTLSWSPTAKLIISGGEDCRYKVWDGKGLSLFSSGVHDHPITSVSWSPAGDLFSVGSFNMIRVCDRYGWSHCMEKVKTGSIYSMHWGPDGTQFVCGTASGHVFLASVIEHTISWSTYEAVLKGRKTVVLRQFTENAEDKLEFRDRVVKMSMDFGYLICVTTGQFYIYNVGSPNTPVVTELRENNAAISLILQAPSYFVLGGGVSISTWTYEGKQCNQVKWGGMRGGMMNKDNSSLSNDVMAFVDHMDGRIVRLFDTVSGKPVSLSGDVVLRMKAEVKQVALSKDNYPGNVERLLAVLDANLDLVIITVRKFGGLATVSPLNKVEGGGGEGGGQRLSTMVTSMMWHNEAPMLAVIRDGRVRVYYFPQILYVDRALLDHTWEDRDLATELGRQPELLSYEGNTVQVRKPDGVVVMGTASSYMAHLHSHAMHGKFYEARRICRYVNTKLVWGVMAGLAAWKKDWQLAEICYSELDLFDRVLFVKDIKENVKGDNNGDE